MIFSYFLQIFSIDVLYVRCTAVDPSDKTHIKMKAQARQRGFKKLNYMFILYQIILRFVKSIEKKILRCCLRRRYLDLHDKSFHMDPLLPFPPYLKR